MPEPSLSIVVPAYGRPESSLLHDRRFLDEAAALSVGIHISDDSPDDAIQRLFESVRTTYDNVHYRRNEPALRHDRNVISSLLWPDSTYVWILGDAFRPRPGALASIVSRLADQDLYFVNWNATDERMVPRLEGQQARDFLVERVWHQTLTGGTIYHDRVRRWWSEQDREVHQNFPHLDVILGYASEHDVVLGWHGEKALASVPKGPSYWTKRALDVFVDDWVDVLRAYPAAVPPERLPEVIGSHSANTGLFNVTSLLTLRASGHLDREATRREHFWDAMHLPRAVVHAVVLVPARVVDVVVSTARRLRQRRRRSAR